MSGTSGGVGTGVALGLAEEGLLFFCEEVRSKEEGLNSPVLGVIA